MLTKLIEHIFFKADQTLVTWITNGADLNFSILNYGFYIDMYMSR